ncbi:MAG: hypothetical protein ACJ0DG_08445 [bacterium]
MCSLLESAVFNSTIYLSNTQVLLHKSRLNSQDFIVPVCSVPYNERIVMANENEKSNWEKIKSFFWNAIVGAIIISIVGFSWLGWVTGGTAQQEAKQMSEEAVNDRLAKICVYQAIQDPGKDQKLKELKEKSSYEKDDYVMKQGWATMPGEEEPEREVADKCAELLLDISQ